MLKNTVKLYDLKKKCHCLPLFDFGKLVKLVSHFVAAVLSLLAERGHGRFMFKSRVFELTAKFKKFLFTFLVDLNLSGSSTTSFIKTFTELFQFTVEFISLFLDLENNVIYIKMYTVNKR